MSGLNDGTMNSYQARAVSTAIYPKTDDTGLTYTILGLVGEAGEMANKYKKVIRDGTPLDRDALSQELGDVLWYVAVTAFELGFSLEDIAKANLNKLQSRKERNMLGGSGDSR